MTRFFFALALCACTPVEAPADISGRVTHVVDGDTWYMNGSDERVRLWGVNAPDRGEPGFEAATETLRALIDGKHLKCFQAGAPSFDRPVVRCNVGGVDIGAAMIEQGAAEEWCKYSRGAYGGC